MHSANVTYDLLTALTPRTVRSFFISPVKRWVSSTNTVSMPENNPSFESMLMLRSMMCSSFEMMEVILFTIPKSSFLRRVG